MKLSARNVWRMARNVEATFRAATPAERTHGTDWYQDAHATAVALAYRYYGVGSPRYVRACAAVLSVLSPSVTWDRNVFDARTLLSHMGKGTGSFKVSTYGPNKMKAYAVAMGELAPSDAFGPTAMKTRAFYETIADPTSHAVVIDGHALSVAMGRRMALRKVPSPTPRQYEHVSDAYRRVATARGVAPSTVQAVTWVHWRNVHLSKAIQRNGV